MTELKNILLYSKNMTMCYNYRLLLYWLHFKRGKIIIKIFSQYFKLALISRPKWSNFIKKWNISKYFLCLHNRQPTWRTLPIWASYSILPYSLIWQQLFHNPVATVVFIFIFYDSVVFQRNKKIFYQYSVEK